MPLSEALAKVIVTPAQAISLLNNLGEGHSDRDPELVTAINKAITELSGGPPAKEAEPEHTSEPHPTGTSRPR